MKSKISCFILDVDGVMTTGQFLYTKDGKAMKVFGPDDNDGLGLLNPFVEIRFVTGDKKGYSISQKRIEEDMGFKLNLVSTIKRIEWIREFYDPKEVIYMGDGIFDHYVMKEVGYSIATANSDNISSNMLELNTSSNTICGYGFALRYFSLLLLASNFKDSVSNIDL